MFDYLKRRRQEATKAKVLAVGSRHADLIDAGLKEWRSSILELKAKLLSDGFDERIVGLNEDDGLTFSELAELEVTAMLKNWIESQQQSLAEAAHYIPAESWEVMGVIGIQDEITSRILSEHEEVGRQLAEIAVQTSNEEARRRGVLGIED